jgi:hypothetical protein
VGADLTTSKDLREFFFKKIKEALHTQKLSISSEVEFYLVNILTHFSLSENFFHMGENGKLELRPLALKLYDAVFDHPDRKFHHLKSLGDTALYHAGVFSTGCFNKNIDIDYYISMGGSAYHSLANMTTSRQKTLGDMFSELSEQFHQLAEVMNLICEKEAGPSDHDLLQILERYHKTKSQKAKAILEEEGISLDDTLFEKALQ